MQHIKCGFRCQIDGDNHFRQLAVYIHINVAQYAVSVHSCKSILMTHDLLAGQQDFQGLYLKTAFKPVRPVLLQGIFPDLLLSN